MARRKSTLDGIPQEDIAILRGAGWTDQHIADMSAAERQAEVEQALEQGVQPVEGGPSEFISPRRKTPPPPVYDWIGSTDALADRLRPKGPSLPVAIIASALVIGIALYAAARALPGPSRPVPYEFAQQDEMVFVLDRYGGSVAACLWQPTSGMVCTMDSATEAMFRRADEAIQTASE